MFNDWNQFSSYIILAEQQGQVTRTFRRLDPTRQQAVIQAILDEAALRGPAALNIKQVAQRAGVSVGSLYQYFPNRDGLLDFAIELCVRYLTDLFEMSRPYLLAMPLSDALRSYLTVGVEWGQTETNLVRFFGRAAYQGDPALAERVVRPIAALMRDLVRDILAQAAARGEIRPDVDVEATARVVNTLMIAIGDSQLLPYLNTYFQVSDGDVTPGRAVEALLALIWSGISPAEP